MTRKIIGISIIAVATVLLIIFPLYEKYKTKPQTYMTKEEKKLLEQIDKQYTTEYEKKYMDNLKEYNFASETIERFVSLLSNKEYEKAYQMLDEQYKKDFHYFFEEFKSNYPFKTKYPKTSIINDFYVVGKNYVAFGEIFDFEAEYQEENTGGGDYLEKTFTVFSNGKIADIGIIEINGMNKTKKDHLFFSSISATIEREYILETGTAYVIALNNKNNTDIHVQDIYAIKENKIKPRSGISKLPSKIPALKSKKYTVFFDHLNKADTLVIQLEGKNEIKISLKK